jgi:hypothetical protein
MASGMRVGRYAELNQDMFLAMFSSREDVEMGEPCLLAHRWARYI